MNFCCCCCHQGLLRETFSDKFGKFIISFIVLQSLIINKMFEFFEFNVVNFNCNYLAIFFQCKKSEGNSCRSIFWLYQARMYTDTEIDRAQHNTVRAQHELCWAVGQAGLRIF